VIGGLMKESTSDTDSGIPFLGRIPIIGWFFKSVSKDSAITETVIFIKATIVKSGGPADKIDRDMQNKFDTNRRKFF
jgi:type II secretory pathway component GspD/PulD (secretin)